MRLGESSDVGSLSVARDKQSNAGASEPPSRCKAAGVAWENIPLCQGKALSLIGDTPVRVTGTVNSSPRDTWSAW
jgi:hypothetical protein